MPRIAAAVAVFALLAPAALAHTARDLWPGQAGNVWTYDVKPAAGDPSKAEMRVLAASGGWARIEGFEGTRWWWMSATTGRIYAWNPSTGRATVAFDLLLGPGKSFASGTPGAPCLDGTVWTIEETHAVVATPVGTFRDAVRIRLSRGPCADAGLTRIVFASGFGIVEYARTTIAGESVATISRAVVGGREYRPSLPPPPPGGPIPPRPPDAATGSEWIERTKSLSRADREKAILAEILAGNVPDFLRSFREIQVSSRGPSGRAHLGTLYVLPDVLAIGSDADFVRIPMGAPTAQKIADAFGCLLPTRRISDEVWRQSGTRLAPRPMTPGAQMMSNAYTLAHQRTIEGQRAAAGHALGDLLAGHKKDVVVTNRLRERPGRVAIYGWHRTGGSPIQPLSTVHEATYADYSHGVRLVRGTMVVDGAERSVAEVLADPELAGLASDEGTILKPRY